MASYRLEDDLDDCPIYESWRQLGPLEVEHHVSGHSTSATRSPIMERMKVRSTGCNVLRMRMISRPGGMNDSSLRLGAERSILT
ncbi:hypothetical protein CRG98_012654 [Punica granatum]|uniref:Uncharacterized protein n=1 Tax=Punica granatum TaxID=22663 RepID=A0A2I0KEQ5_PUNGR|nr:hypothetical protein CRG98_012654 [Punica granatum]